MPKNSQSKVKDVPYSFENIKVKGQSYWPLVNEYNFWTINGHLFPFDHETSYIRSTCVNKIWVKDQGQEALVIEIGFRTITDNVFHLGS